MSFGLAFSISWTMDCRESALFPCWARPIPHRVTAYYSIFSKSVVIARGMVRNL